MGDVVQKFQKNKRGIGDVGSETTYLHLKAYKCVIPQSYGLKVF